MNSPVAQTVVSKYHFSVKGTRFSLGKKADPRLEVGTHRMSLGHPIISEKQGNYQTQPVLYYKGSAMKLNRFSINDQRLGHLGISQGKNNYDD